MKHSENAAHYKLVEDTIRLLERQAYPPKLGGDNPEPSLLNLAQQLGTSPTHLQRTFTAWAGVSPKQFFQCLQKDHARRLIAAGQSMLNTSTELGLASTSKLHHLMLKFEAMTPGEIKAQGQGLELTIGQASSPFGKMFACLTPKGLNNLEFMTDSLGFENWQTEIAKLYPKAAITRRDKDIEKLVSQIFQPRPHQSTTHLSLHLRGTPFQLQVWQALLHIPPAQLVSYQQLASKIGKPSASRAVGSAIAKNPVAYLVPCHRVIQATGELGQYRWNSARKKALHVWEHGLTTL